MMGGPRISRGLQRACLDMRTPVALAALALVAGLSSAFASDSTQIERGRYLATIMDCGGCHTGGALMGKPDPGRYLAGSEVGFELPGLGIFYPRNLTGDPETGLGQWSKDDVVIALRTGVRPDGRELAPIMPWRMYRNLTDEDVSALAAYIKSLPAVSFQAPGPFGPDEPATAPHLSIRFPDGEVKSKAG